MCCNTCKPTALDDFSGRTIPATLAELNLAAARFDLMLVTDGEATLNDFYDLVGLEPIQLGQDLGWSNTEPFSLRFTAIMHHEEPVISFSFRDMPKKSLSDRRQS